MKRRGAFRVACVALLALVFLGTAREPRAKACGAGCAAPAADALAGSWLRQGVVDCTGRARAASGAGHGLGLSRVEMLASASLPIALEPTAGPALAPSAAPPREILWLSLSTDTRSWNDEDIVQLDPATGTYYWVFDGSDMGITTDVDAFDVLPSGHILMSFDAATSVLGLGTVYDSDIVEFEPYELGANTTGTFSWIFDSSDVGLSDVHEDIDALSMLRDGSLIVSLRETFSVFGISGQDEDLIRFTATSWGATTAGSWSWYFRGADVGLSTTANEDVDGIWIDQAVVPNPEIYFTTLGSFAVPGVAGENEDIFVFQPAALGAPTGGVYRTRLYLDGSLFSLEAYDIDAFDIRR